MPRPAQRGPGHPLGGWWGPDVLDMPDPVPGDGEQLFDISACGVNFADTHLRLSAD
jgi:hypothetical protein